MVSVVMPTYNRGNIISRSIDSVLSQSFSDFELIIVDDGSNDNTDDVINNFDDDRIKYIKLDENRGACNARNHGMNISRGDIIAFIDSDNEWFPEYLEKQICVLEKKEIDISFFKMQRINSDGSKKIFPNICSPFFGDELYKRMLIANVMDTNVTCIRRKLFTEYGGFDTDFPRYQDWDFFLSLIENGANAVFNDSVVATCYTMKDSISTRNDYREKAFICLLNKHNKFMKKQKCMDKAILFMINMLEGQNCQELTDGITKVLTQETRIAEFDHVALYGYGKNGKAIYNILKGSEKINAIVDRYCDTPKDINVPFFRAVDELEKSDCVIVTVYDKCEEIVNEIKSKITIPVFSFEEISNE